MLPVWKSRNFKICRGGKKRKKKRKKNGDANPFMHLCALWFCVITNNTPASICAVVLCKCFCVASPIISSYWFNPVFWPIICHLLLKLNIYAACCTHHQAVDKLIPAEQLIKFISWVLYTKTLLVALIKIKVSNFNQALRS